MENVLPIVTISFVLTCLLTVILFYKAGKSKVSIGIILSWMSCTAILGISGFYQNFESLPPRIVFLAIPAFIYILIVFNSKPGKSFTESLDLKWLTLLHVVRLPVELILHKLYSAGTVPDLMTYDGYNFDILSGLSAPFIYYFTFIKKKMGFKYLLIWNILCLLLLINIVTIAVLSFKSPYQILALNQPNIAISYFPYIWLPSLIVPIVFYAHIVSIKRLR